MQLRVSSALVLALGLGQAFGWYIVRSGNGQMSASAYREDGSLVDENDPNYQMEPQLPPWYEDPKDKPADRYTKEYWYPVSHWDKYLQGYSMEGVTVTFFGGEYDKIMRMKKTSTRFDKGRAMREIKGWTSGEIYKLTGEEKTVLISYQ